ncbi:nucleotide disphospho-sugar-binding domain-containing protein [Streptomyces sp. NPDC013740]|uniref:nucleotide disphospho-sugar-binding domain-containing protein n=1 Tax=Streptomyces sp. NPDC013740 TaxID=3364867 RepID=UPI0036FCD7B8
MRVLFLTSPGLGHLFPTIPLAQAFRAAGHRVRYATGGLSLAAADAGFDVVDVTPGLDYLPVYLPREPGADGAPVDHPMFAEDPDDAELATLFARVSGVMVDGALAAARQWSPDLVVAPPLQGAGRLVAAALRVPLIEPRLGSYDSGARLRSLLRAGMAPHWDRHGVSGEPAETIPLTTLPDSLTALLPEDRRTPLARPLRHVPYNGGSVLPAWLAEPPGSPRIAVTLGTIEAQWGGLAILEPLMEAARGVEAEFVVTLGGGDPALLGDAPPNVRLVDWAPLDLLLHGCDAIIHHGGSGTMLTAAAAGLPQCVIPRGSYQQTGADLLPARGIGIVAEAKDLGAAQCLTLLDDESLRENARQVRDELRAMPTPAETAARLVAAVG